jgi:Asp-tRNA(Asn)/Glu-tRNA(Gln) amidotransferase C subunit
VHYEWIGREDTQEYMQSIEKWRKHTSEETFATEFNRITEQFKDNNDLRTEKIETFLINEAMLAGVVRKHEHKIQRNPNRWAKHLAPWFEDTCRTAR